MKIRTDFVTNSSSSSFLVLRITSKPLAELFSRNEEAISAFFSPDRDFYGKYSVSGDRISIEGGIPDSDIGGDVPKTPDDIAWCLASLLTMGNVTEEEQIDEDFTGDLEEVLRELFAREEVFSDTLESVYWESGTQGYSAYDESLTQYFTYDPENGPSYRMEQTEGLDDEDF